MPGKLEPDSNITECQIYLDTTIARDPEYESVTIVLVISITELCSNLCFSNLSAQFILESVQDLPNAPYPIQGQTIADL